MKKVQVLLSPFYRWICWDMERGKKTIQITWNLGGQVGVRGQVCDLTSRLSCKCAVDFSGGCPLKAGACQRSPMGAVPWGQWVLRLSLWAYALMSPGSFWSLSVVPKGESTLPSLFLTSCRIMVLPFPGLSPASPDTCLSPCTMPSEFLFHTLRTNKVYGLQEKSR